MTCTYCGERLAGPGRDGMHPACAGELDAAVAEARAAVAQRKLRHLLLHSITEAAVARGDMAPERARRLQGRVYWSPERVLADRRERGR